METLPAGPRSWPRGQLFPRASVAVALLVSACHVWKPVQLDASRNFINGRTRIARTDGSTIIVRGPRLVGDSVVGTHANTQARVALARSDVQRIDVEHISRGRTALVGAGLLLLYWAYIAALADSPTYYDQPN